METVQEWIDLLAHTTCPIIVEGKKDKSALETFGITHVYTIDRPLFELVELISEKYKCVIILTDLDKAGKELYAKLASDFSKRGVHIDNSFRDFLFKHTSLSHIEGLVHYASNHK